MPDTMHKKKNKTDQHLKGCNSVNSNPNVEQYEKSSTKHPEGEKTSALYLFTHIFFTDILIKHPLKVRRD